MGGKSSKAKGANGEREALKWFASRFDLPDLSRNLLQTREGGADCLGIPGVALEVKRQETLTLPAWWRQTTDQAIAADAFPVLMYRQNRKQWQFCLPASLITPGSWGYLTLSSGEFEHWFRKWLTTSGKAV